MWQFSGVVKCVLVRLCHNITFFYGRPIRRCMDLSTSRGSIFGTPAFLDERLEHGRLSTYRTVVPHLGHSSFIEAARLSDVAARPPHYYFYSSNNFACFVATNCSGSTAKQAGKFPCSKRPDRHLALYRRNFICNTCVSCGSSPRCVPPALNFHHILWIRSHHMILHNSCRWWINTCRAGNVFFVVTNTLNYWLSRLLQTIQLVCLI